MRRHCSPLVSPLRLPGSQPNTWVSGVALCEADFTGLGGLQPEPWFPPVPCRGLLLPGFLHTLPLQSGPLGRTRWLLWGVWVRGVPCPSDYLGIVATGVIFSLHLPHCPISMSEAVLSASQAPGPLQGPGVGASVQS